MMGLWTWLLLSTALAAPDSDLSDDPEQVRATTMRRLAERAQQHGLKDSHALMQTMAKKGTTPDPTPDPTPAPTPEDYRPTQLLVFDRIVDDFNAYINSMSSHAKDEALKYHKVITELQLDVKDVFMKLDMASAQQQIAGQQMAALQGHEKEVRDLA